MKTLQFSTDIVAPKEKVWSALWEDANYRRWTTVFSAGSYAESDWQEGSTIRFLGPDGGGMYSIIAKKELNSFMAFLHVGEVREFENQPVDEAAGWTGATETYRLEEITEGTRLLVEVDVTGDHEEYFRKAFPQALEEVKRIAEEKHSRQTGD